MLHNVRPLRIEAARGRSQRLVVSFTSVGNKRHHWPAKEFVGTLSAGGENHLLTVTDISRSWMNRDGMDETIEDVISSYVLRNRITEIVAVGISMGGFNALVFSRMVPVGRVIAFAPQYSPNPKIVKGDKRWLHFRKAITDWPHPELDTLPAPPARVYIFHGDAALEKLHWRRFPKASNVMHYIFPGSDHAFIRPLHESGAIPQIIDAVLSERPSRVPRLVRRAGGMGRAAYDSLEAANDYFAARRKPRRLTTTTA